jgi:hypothetical protein
MDLSAPPRTQPMAEPGEPAEPAEQVQAYA